MKTINACILCAMLILFLSNCSNNDDPEPTNEVPFQTALADRQAVILIPTAFANNNTNTYAIQTRQFINVTNANFNAFNGLLLLPGITQFNGNGTWTWSDGAGNSVTYTARLNNDEYQFSYQISLADGTMYKLFEGTEKADGTSGVFTGFEEDGSIALLMEWSYMDALFTTTLTTGDIKIISRSNDNLSGTIEYFENNVLIFEGEWESSGSGSCVSYDDAGTQVDQGAW